MTRLLKNLENNMEEVFKEENSNDIRCLILSYLIYNCYEETAILFSQAISFGDTKNDSTAAANARIDTNNAAQPSFDEEGDVEMESSNTASNLSTKLVSNNQKSTTTLKSNHLGDTVISAMLKTLSDRKAILSFIKSGNIEAAIEKCAIFFPGVLKKEEQKISNNSEVNVIEISFQLYCLQFIELVRSGKPADALYFAQRELSEFGKKKSSFLDPLRDIVALIAYQEPQKSPVGQYLSQEHRDNVAEYVNNAILSTVMSGSSLVKLLKQLIVVKNFLDDDSTSKENTKKSSNNSLNYSNKISSLQDIITID